MRLLLITIVLVFIQACASQTTHTKSSVMDYLYPDSQSGFSESSKSQLRLPLRVGIAFVPSETARTRAHIARFYGGDANTFSETKKMVLAEKVADYFNAIEFIDHIEVIPTSYLRPGGGFENLSQIKTMFGIDVIALISYDQIQFTDESLLSLSYLTIVGAYMVSGEKNETLTLMDTVLYDISSRKMLFRAPGRSEVLSRSTAVELSGELRADSIKGFDLAAENMVANLNEALEKFKQDIAKKPGEVKIIHREGYGGGGIMSVSNTATMFAFLLAIGFRSFRRRIG